MDPGCGCPEDRVRQFAEVAPAMNERIKPNTILAGDFNVDLRKGEGKWTDLCARPAHNLGGG